MATREENLSRFNEIARRGLQDQLPPEIRLRFDEALKRGLIQSQRSTVPEVSELERSQALENINKDIGPIESTLIAAGRGLTDIGRAAGLADPETEIVKQAFTGLEEQRPITQTVGRALGQAAPFLAPGLGVGAIASTPLRVAAATGLGVAEGGAIAKGAEVGNVAETAVLGGAISGTLELVFPVLGRIGRKLIERFKGSKPSTPVFKNGKPSTELLDALDSAGLTIDDLGEQSLRALESGDVTDKASLARKSFLEEQGITPTRAQITGDVTEFQSQQELLKTSGPVQKAISAQESALEKRFENAITATGGSATNPTNPVVDFIADRSIDLDAEISNAYKLAKQQAGDEKIVRPVNLVATIKDIAGSDRATGGLISAARDILKSKGLLGKKGLNITGKIDAAVAEEIRKDLNSLFDSLTPFGRKKLRALKNSLDNDVARDIGEDVFANARQSKAKFEKDLSRSKVNKFDKRNANVVRKILENKVNPDRFLNETVLSKAVRSSDINQLKDYLIRGGDDGLEAWNSLRAETMQHIKDKAFNEVGGELALSRSKLNSVLDSIGTQKLKVIFSSEENKFLRNMLNVSRLREPKRGTALGQGPTGAAVNELRREIQKRSLIGDIFSGFATDTKGAISIRAPRLIKDIDPTALRAAAPLLATQQENQ